jgi:hypothetical protein
LIGAFENEDDLVLDPFCGSGSMLVIVIRQIVREDTTTRRYNETHKSLTEERYRLAEQKRWILLRGPELKIDRLDNPLILSLEQANDWSGVTT